MLKLSYGIPVCSQAIKRGGEVFPRILAQCPTPIKCHSTIENDSHSLFAYLYHIVCNLALGRSRRQLVGGVGCHLPAVRAGDATDRARHQQSTVPVHQSGQETLDQIVRLFWDY